MDGIILLCPAAAGMLMLLVIFVEHMNAWWTMRPSTWKGATAWQWCRQSSALVKFRRKFATTCCATSARRQSGAAATLF